jgi:hypothetical protein
MCQLRPEPLTQLVRRNLSREVDEIHATGWRDRVPIPVGLDDQVRAAGIRHPCVLGTDGADRVVREEPRPIGAFEIVQVRAPMPWFADQAQDGSTIQEARLNVVLNVARETAMIARTIGDVDVPVGR